MPFVPARRDYAVAGGKRQANQGAVRRFTVHHFPPSFALLAPLRLRSGQAFAVKTRLDLRQPAIVDNFLEEVLGGISGRFLGGHRPWRWRPGAFFGGRGGNGKMGKRFFGVFDPLFARF
jgi:hypothetical protein